MTFTTKITLSLLAIALLSSCTKKNNHEIQQTKKLYNGYEFVERLDKGEEIYIEEIQGQWRITTKQTLQKKNIEVLRVNHKYKKIGLGFNGWGHGINKETDFLCSSGILGEARKGYGYIPCTSTLTKINTNKTAKYHTHSLGIPGLIGAVVGTTIYVIDYDYVKIDLALKEININNIIELNKLNSFIADNWNKTRNLIEENNHRVDSMINVLVEKTENNKFPANITIQDKSQLFSGNKTKLTQKNITYKSTFTGNRQNYYYKDKIHSPFTSNQSIADIELYFGNLNSEINNYTDISIDKLQKLKKPL